MYVYGISMAVGPVAPPVASGVDLTRAPFKQCGGAPIGEIWGMAMKMHCNPGTRGRYMYVYNNMEYPTSIRMCEARIAGTSRY